MLSPRRQSSKRCLTRLFEVVFDSGAGNRFWKDAMVAFVSNVPGGSGKFIGFYDRVAGQMHPAAGFSE
jgi:hypothetical protein